MTAPAQVTLPAYAEWLLQQPRLRDALDTLTSTDAIPADAGSHVDLITELQCAREV